MSEDSFAMSRLRGVTYSLDDAEASSVENAVSCGRGPERSRHHEHQRNTAAVRSRPAANQRCEMRATNENQSERPVVRENERRENLLSS